MVNDMHAILGAWESYYVILGSSAAALTGLQFVVIALVAETPALRSVDSVGAFGTPTVVHFCHCLFVSAVLSAPWGSLAPVAWLLAAAGCAGLLYTLLVLRRARRQSAYRPVMEDWLCHVILPMVAYGALVPAAVWLPREPAAMLFLVGAAVLVLIFVGIHNAWDAVAYIVIRHRSQG